jgi:hypothetical protein
MVFKLVEAAQNSWRRLDAHAQLPKLILGVKFVDGMELAAKPTYRQPATAAARPARPSPRFGDSSVRLICKRCSQATSLSAGTAG